MPVVIKPSRAHGSVFAPPSKSVAHRALICAALSQGVSIINNVSLSQDISATLDCLKALGADISFDSGTCTVTGVSVGAMQ